MTKREFESMTRQQRRRWCVENVKAAVTMLTVFAIACGLDSWVG